MTRLFTIFLLLALLFTLIFGQDDVESRKQQARKARRQKLDQRTKNGARLPKDHIVHTLDIAYPLKLFESDRDFDWRQQARFSAELHELSAGGEYQEYVAIYNCT
jgi:hypothetical protein